MKKTYMSPMIEVEEYEDLCQTGMNNTSFKTRTTLEAEDQKDVDVVGPDIANPPTDPTDPPQPPINWDW